MLSGKINSLKEEGGDYCMLNSCGAQDMPGTYRYRKNDGMEHIIVEQKGT